MAYHGLGSDAEKTQAKVTSLFQYLKYIYPYTEKVSTNLSSFVKPLSLIMYRCSRRTTSCQQIGRSLTCTSVSARSYAQHLRRAPTRSSLNIPRFLRRRI